MASIGYLCFMHVLSSKRYPLPKHKGKAARQLHDTEDALRSNIKQAEKQLRGKINNFEPALPSKKKLKKNLKSARKDMPASMCSVKKLYWVMGLGLLVWGIKHMHNNPGRVKCLCHDALPEQVKDLNDATLQAKVESEIFRPADAPKGDVNVDVHDGIVTLRGTIDSHTKLQELVEVAQEIPEVRIVRNIVNVRPVK
jgi:hypothetical protein